jgi:hypothetical protein
MGSRETTDTTTKENEMKVAELIAELSKLPPDTLVYAWKNDRYEVLEIDDSYLAEDGFIDINLGE